MSQSQGAEGANQTDAASGTVVAAEFEDCTPCRVMGGATFIGLGIYALTLRPEATSSTANAKPFARAVARYAPQMRGGVGAGFILLGVYRLLL